VNADAAIASKVLQITNSAFFRLRKPMVRIKDAVTYLGFATIRNLVLSAEIRRNGKLYRAILRWTRATTEPCTVRCGRVQVAGRGRVSADDAWLAGLLHDIGYWVLVQECPDELTRALELATGDTPAALRCERQTTGATHAQIGAYLLGLWACRIPSSKRLPCTTRRRQSPRWGMTCSVRWPYRMRCSNP